jgi:capsid protein
MPIDGDRIIHLFEPTRPGMVREVPFLYPVMNDLHDLDDLQTLEMKAAKSNADVANVLTNKTGEATVTASRRQKWQIQSQDKDGNPVNKQAPLFYETTLGGRTIYVSNGEKFEQFKSDRPSVSTKEYWDYLVRKICAGVGISALLVLPFSLQGTVTRADMDVAASFFRSRSGVLAAVLREIYLWAMSWAVKYDRALDGAPAEWWHVAIRPPRSIVVDLGRNSWAITEELDAGIRSVQDVCAEMGQDWRHVLRQRAVEASYVNKLVTEYGVSREQIVKPPMGSTQGTGNPEPTSQTTEGPAKPEPATPEPATAKTAATAPMIGHVWNVIRDDTGKILRYEPA